LGRRRLGLDGREHGSTLDWHGAKQACQHQPSNDVAAAPSMCVIVLTDVFGPGGGSGTAQPAVDVKLLHAKIGELTLENDFLEGALGKAGLLSAKR
jgi:transposase